MTTQDAFADNLDLMGEVPESSGGFKSIGKLTISTRLFVWRNGKTEDASLDDWKRTPKVVDGKGAKGMDIIFHVDVQELRSSLQFPYERKVTLNSMDWDKLVAPSIEKVMGAGSMKDDKRSATLRELNGKYVMVQDVPQTPRKNAAADAKQYNTISLVKVYPSREAAYAESKTMGGSESNGASTGASDPMMPSDPSWTRESWYVEAKKEVDAMLAQAEAGAKTPPAKAKARKEALSKFASDYGCTEAQAEHLANYK